MLGYLYEGFVEFDKRRVEQRQDPTIVPTRVAAGRGRCQARGRGPVEGHVVFFVGIQRIQREKMIAAMGELNALLKFLPVEVRGKVGGFFPLVTGSMNEKRLPEFFLQRITERPKPSAGLVRL